MEDIIHTVWYQITNVGESPELLGIYDDEDKLKIDLMGLAELYTKQPDGVYKKRNTGGRYSEYIWVEETPTNQLFDQE